MLDCTIPTRGMLDSWNSNKKPQTQFFSLFLFSIASNYMWTRFSKMTVLITDHRLQMVSKKNSNIWYSWTASQHNQLVWPKEARTSRKQYSNTKCLMSPPTPQKNSKNALTGRVARMRVVKENHKKEHLYISKRGSPYMHTHPSSKAYNKDKAKNKWTVFL